MKWQLSKKQKEDLKEIGWTPTGFWFGLDWDYKGNALDIITRFMGEKLPDADGYDFIVIAYRKSYKEECIKKFYNIPIDKSKARRRKNEKKKSTLSNERR